MDLGGFPTIDLPIEDLLLIDKIKGGNYKITHAPEARVYYFRFPETISDVYKKWSNAAYCSFAVKKSERGFGKQLVIFGLFFLSVFLEVLQFIIPRRSFEIYDVLANFAGVLVAYCLIKILKSWKSYK